MPPHPSLEKSLFFATTPVTFSRKARAAWGVGAWRYCVFRGRARRYAGTIHTPVCRSGGLGAGGAVASGRFIIFARGAGARCVYVARCKFQRTGSALTGSSVNAGSVWRVKACALTRSRVNGGKHTGFSLTKTRVNATRGGGFRATKFSPIR